MRQSRRPGAMPKIPGCEPVGGHEEMRRDGTVHGGDLRIAICSVNVLRVGFGKWNRGRSYDRSFSCLGGPVSSFWSMERRTLPRRGTPLRGVSAGYAVAVKEMVKGRYDEFFCASPGKHEGEGTGGKEPHPIVARRWVRYYETSQYIRVYCHSCG